MWGTFEGLGCDIWERIAILDSPPNFSNIDEIEPPSCPPAEVDHFEDSPFWLRRIFFKEQSDGKFREAEKLRNLQLKPKFERRFGRKFEKHELVNGRILNQFRRSTVQSY